MLEIQDVLLVAQDSSSGRLQLMRRYPINSVLQVPAICLLL